MGGSFGLAYSQEIEKRQMGLIGGLEGVIKPEASKFKVNFIISEHESPRYEAKDTAFAYPVCKSVKIHLKPFKESLSNEALFQLVRVLKQIDEDFSSKVYNATRRLVCPTCKLIGRENGSFELQQRLILEDADTATCSADSGHCLEPSYSLLFNLETASTYKQFSEELRELEGQTTQDLSTSFDDVMDEILLRHMIKPHRGRGNISKNKQSNMI